MPMPFQVTKPAMLAAVAYIVMAFVILLPLNGGCDPREPGCYTFPKRLLVVTLMLIPIGLSVYSINCMMVGKCVVWSWVNSVFIALWVLLFMVATVMSFDSRSTMQYDQVYVIETI